MLLADFCNRVSQATKFLLKKVVVRKNSKVVSSLSKMFSLGFIFMYAAISSKYMDIKLKYQGSESVIRNIFLISKMSLNIYIKNDDILKMLRDNFFCLSGFLTFFTNKGHMLDTECFLHGIGGKAATGFY